MVKYFANFFSGVLALASFICLATGNLFFGLWMLGLCFALAYIGAEK